MQQYEKLDINVSVSQELRDIIVARRPGSGNADDQPRPQQICGASMQSPVRAQKYIVLQCNGNRPLKFLGTLVATFTGNTPLADVPLTWVVSLYITTAGEPILSLSLNASYAAELRPLLLATKLEPYGAVNPPNSWVEQIRTVIAAVPLSKNFITEREINRAFHNITCRCFRPMQHLEERNTQ